MGCCRYANVLIGLSAGGAELIAVEYFWVVACIPLFNVMYVFGLTHLARHEVHGADRNVVLRWATYLFVVACLPVACAPVIFEERAIWQSMALLLIPVWLLPEFLKLMRDVSAVRIRFAVLRCIMGITVITGSFTLFAGGLWQGSLILALLYPGKWFGRWFYAT